MIRKDELRNDVSRFRKLFFGIADAIKYIHAQNIIHRDLKPENIFLTENDTIKLGDFGISTTRLSLCEKRCGTEYYMAPEIGNKGATARADMYSFGIILFEMCVPMTYYTRNEILKKIRAADVPIEESIEEFIPFIERFLFPNVCI